MIELLTVIAVGAILMAMVIPLAQGARRQYSILETKTRFSRYTLALEDFKAEYGHYPAVNGTAGESPVVVNAASERFVQLMSGRNLSGGVMDEPVALSQNPKGLAFLRFNNAELTSDGRLQDSFGQTNWELFFDTDADGFLNGLVGVRGSIGWRSSGQEVVIKSW